jgi:hypothetical protein
MIAERESYEFIIHHVSTMVTDDPMPAALTNADHP